MIFLFMLLRKMSRNKNVKIKIYHMSQIILKDKIGWRSCHIFPMGCCKSVQYDSKGCCSNNMLFLMLVLVMGFLFVILGKNQETNLRRSTFTTCHKSFQKIGGESVHIFSNMGCCKSVHYDSKGCCSNNIVF